jgi:hypothetical protein
MYVYIHICIIAKVEYPVLSAWIENVSSKVYLFVHSYSYYDINLHIYMFICIYVCIYEYVYF